MSPDRPLLALSRDPDLPHLCPLSPHSVCSMCWPSSLEAGGAMTKVLDCGLHVCQSRPPSLSVLVTASRPPPDCLPTSLLPPPRAPYLDLDGPILSSAAADSANRRESATHVHVHVHDDSVSQRGSPSQQTKLRRASPPLPPRHSTTTPDLGVASDDRLT